MNYKIYKATNPKAGVSSAYVVTDLEGLALAEFIVTAIQNRNCAQLTISPNTYMLETRFDVNVLLSEFTEVEFNIGDFVGDYIDFYFNNYLKNYVDGKGISSRARKIRTQVCTSWKMSYLYASISSDEILDEVIEEIRGIYICPCFTSEEADILRYGTLNQKKSVIRNIISTKAFNAMQIQTRGHKYIDALAHELMRCVS